MQLRSKDISKLKSLAHHLNPVFQIGKDGITENMLIDLNNYLHKHELMKVSILNNCMLDKEEIKEILSDYFTVVQIIGNVVVLYKPNKQLPNSIKL